MTTLILSVFFSISASAYDVEVDGITYELYSTNPNKAAVKKITTGTNIIIPNEISYNGNSYIVDKIYSISDLPYSDFFQINKYINNIDGCITNNNTKCYIVDSENQNFDTIDGVLYNKEHTSVISYPVNKEDKDYIMPQSVKTIKGNLFCNCKYLEKIYMSDNIEYLPYMFCWDWGKNIYYLKLSDKIKNIESNTFYDDKLKEVILPKELETLGVDEMSIVANVLPWNIEKLTIKNSKIPNITYHSRIGTIHCLSNQNKLAEIHVEDNNPIDIDEDAFMSTHYSFVKLYVPKGCVDLYKSKKGWKNFLNISEEGDSQPEEVKKCNTPIITYDNGVIKFDCSTENSKISSKILCDDVKIYNDNQITLKGIYTISCFANADGYQQSDVATAKLYWLPSSGTLEGDNINNVAMRGIAIQSAGGFINISGLDNNEKVNFYGVDGKALGTATSINGTTSFSAQSGTIVVAKIGKESIKISVK